MNSLIKDYYWDIDVANGKVTVHRQDESVIEEFEYENNASSAIEKAEKMISDLKSGKILDK